MYIYIYIYSYIHTYIHIFIGAALRTPSTPSAKSISKPSSVIVADKNTQHMPHDSSKHEEALSTSGLQQSSIALLISGFLPGKVCSNTYIHVRTHRALFHALQHTAVHLVSLQHTAMHTTTYCNIL